MSKSKNDVPAFGGLVPQFQEVKCERKESDVAKLQADAVMYKELYNESHEKVLTYERGRYNLQTQLQRIRDSVGTLKGFCAPEINTAPEVAIIFNLLLPLVVRVDHCLQNEVFTVSDELPF